MDKPQCRIVELPKIVDQRGNLTFIEAQRHIPFDFERVYYLYDVPGGAARGGHAHRLAQLRAGEHNPGAGKRVVGCAGKYSPKAWNDVRSSRDGIGVETIRVGSVGELEKLVRSARKSWKNLAPLHFAVQSSELRRGSTVKRILDCLPLGPRWQHRL